MYTCKTCGWTGEVNGRQQCLACARVRTTKWRKANPAMAKAQKHRYEAKFKAERRDAYNAKRRRNRSAKRNHQAYMRRKRWLLAGSVRRDDLIEIWELSEGLCYYCSRAIGKPRFSPYDMRGFDHKLARKDGGRNDKENIVACCRQCNELKG